MNIFYSFQFIQFFNKTLCHGSFAGLGPETFYQSLILTYIILLVFKSLLLQIDPDGFFFFIIIKIAIINMELLLIQLDNFCHHPVQKIFIMTYNNN